MAEPSAISWRFCFIGGVAVQRWGEPRVTQDVDLTILAELGREERFADALLERFPRRRHDAREFALRHRVLLLRTTDGIDVDIAFGALPFEERTVQRSSPWIWNADDALITCSAEDLIVHKAFAGRDLDWADVERVLTRQHGKLDLAQVREELQPLLDLEGEPEAMTRLEGKDRRSRLPSAIDLRFAVTAVSDRTLPRRTESRGRVINTSGTVPPWRCDPAELLAGQLARLVTRPPVALNPEGRVPPNPAGDTDARHKVQCRPPSRRHARDRSGLPGFCRSDEPHPAGI